MSRLQQELIYSSAYDKTKDEIVEFVGVMIPFDSPFYLFFSLDDLMDSTAPKIYIVGYEMKPSGPSFWGFIDRKRGNNHRRQLHAQDVDVSFYDQRMEEIGVYFG